MCNLSDVQFCLYMFIEYHNVSAVLARLYTAMSQPVTTAASVLHSRIQCPLLMASIQPACCLSGFHVFPEFGTLQNLQGRIMDNIEAKRGQAARP